MNQGQGENGSVAKKCKWTLCMIVRDCAPELERALKSIAAYPDEIVVVNTALSKEEPGYKETNAIAERFGAKVFDFPWIEDFSAARNFSFSKASHDVVMWMDSDDTVENAAEFSRNLHRAFAGEEVECLYVEYLYDFDDNGQCTTVLTRERVVNRTHYEWRAPIHEVLCETFHVRGAKLPPQFGRIKHHHRRDDAAQKASLERNLRVLEHWYLPVEQGGKGEYCEERMLFYWANTCMGLHRLEEALQKYLEYIPRSGSNAEIQQALGSASECARLLERYPEAKALAQQAIERNPNAPTPYWFLAQAHAKSGNFALAEHYAMECLSRADKFQQEMVANPKVVFGGSALLAATAKYKQGRSDGLLQLLQVAEKYYTTNDPVILEMRHNLRESEERQRLLDSYNRLKDEIEREGGVEAVRKLAQIAPAGLKGEREVARYLPRVRPAGKPSIMFLAGGGMPGGWGPELLKTGIGGSEEAVCYLSEQFVKKGWHVEVYAPCARQTWNGVEWYPEGEFPGPDDETMADVLIVWRTPWAMMYLGSKARRSYLWLHDMPNRSNWLHGIWNGFDGIFVLSKFHSEAYDFVPPEKKILSANGLPLDRLVPVDQLANEPKRMLYASDPLRGLETVLTWWEQIRKAVPGAELEVYYGFHPTLMEHTKHKDPLSRAITQQVKRIDDLRKQDGINWHGFVGHEVLHRGFARCGLWIYPTEFPEISAITAMKAQAHGVIPVTVNKFALAETVQRGVKIDNWNNTVDDQKRWFDEVVRLANNPWTQEQRVEMALHARATFSWEKVADQWIAQFTADLQKPGRDRVYDRNRMDLIRTS